MCVCVFIILMLMSQPSHLRSLIWQSVFKSCTRVVHSVMLWSFDWPFWHYFHLALLSLFVLQKNQSVHFLCWIIFLALWRVEGMKKCTDSFTIIFTFHMPPLNFYLLSVLLLLSLLQLSFRFWSHLSPHTLRINTCLVKIIMTSFILQPTDRISWKFCSEIWVT